MGVPASTLLFAALVLICPLMMIFMMVGMHAGPRAPGRGGHGAAEPHDPTGGPSNGRDRKSTGDRR